MSANAMCGDFAGRKMTANNESRLHMSVVTKNMQSQKTERIPAHTFCGGHLCRTTKLGSLEENWLHERLASGFAGCGTGHAVTHRCPTSVLGATTL